jgi:hypothetical protein
MPVNILSPLGSTMKILFNLFNHLTEVIMPALACLHGWDTCHEKDIKLRICQSIGIDVPRYPSRSVTSIHDLKLVLIRCYEIIENPATFMTNETKHNPRS